MQIKFLEVAQKELDENIDYYNQESPGLGERFLNQVLEGLDRIATFPQSLAEVYKKDKEMSAAIFPLWYYISN